MSKQRTRRKEEQVAVVGSFPWRSRGHHQSQSPAMAQETFL